MNVFTVCLSLRGLLLVAGGRPRVLSQSMFTVSSHGSLLAASALVAFKYSTRACKMQQMLGREKARLLFMEEGAGERNEKKTTQGVAQQKPFLLSVTRLRALLRDAPVPGGMKVRISILLGMPSGRMSRSLRSKKVPNPQIPVPGAPDVGGPRLHGPHPGRHG